MAINGRCCVFQPFDNGGPHDKRYADTIAPAIEAAGLEPYRVDKDDGAVIPMDTLHDEIKSATICLADISTHNPNVMYELGYAIASGKDVVLLALSGTSFPFDVQHRGVLKYTLESASDFEKLRSAIINRLTTLVARQATKREIVSASPIKSTHGLQPNEVAALAFVMANVDSPEDRVSTEMIKRDMERAGFTRLATQLALARLSRLSFVEVGQDADYNGNTFAAYRILGDGESWLLDNQDQLELGKGSSPEKIPMLDDEIPF
jgi:nucleoside 2-deoxyribosyltransferase